MSNQKGSNRKILLRSLLAALVVEITGATVNLISYAIDHSFLLAIRIDGGELVNWLGFGMMLYHTYPMWFADQPVEYSKTWIEFEPISLVLTLIVSFVVALIIQLVKRRTVSE